MQANDAQMLVLCALADGPLHGYAVNAAIERLVGERLGPGSLYGALTRLEAKGLVEPGRGVGAAAPRAADRRGAGGARTGAAVHGQGGCRRAAQPGGEPRMSVADRLVRLYPAAFRDRWGEATVEEVTAAGWRGWSEALRGAADLWLYPVLWPVDPRPVRGWARRVRAH